MQKNYDVIIVGAGPAGIMASYEFYLKDPSKKVLLIDKGQDVMFRHCPIKDKKIKSCPVIKDNEPGCLPACSITSGFGGAGAYSDGKFNITSEFGGWLTDYMDNQEVEDVIHYVDELYLKHGATLEITDPTTDKIKEIEKRGYAVGLKLLRAKVRHLGTEENLRIMTEMSNELKKHIDEQFKTAVKDILVEDNRVKGIILENGEEIYAPYVVLAPGRDGSTWLTKVLKNQGLELYNNQVDIGVRVETSNIVMDEINTHLYEGKFVYNASVGTKVRTFCSNPSGHVVVENHSGTMLANGHAYHDPKLGSPNTNFALLVSHVFSEPFNEPNEFAHEVSGLANMLSHGSIIVQRYGDIKRGRRTTEKRLKEGYTIPTLPEAVPGDLGLVLPYNTMKSIIEMIEALDHVTPGIANEHTLLYGVEAKFYSARPKVRDGFESEIDGLYVGGDGAGLTRGLAQAGANGIIIARSIIEKSK
ncbi:NAD(P)/FAD-dependent oxidoreductase [Candidatus Stoquefichus massiliensis]|uniref:NAD(P)/FAD-dependent oxidoreductase n=1 Tax=Candidatus Stoquefichus massiliensis TaxID=1470350 RepID=UPI000485404F|nr:NAD(P)/FAD-dependent oxidoreductase [Candidatus Stoquefichus massiliensis]